jgi:tRNA G18 (ribose-2'-O)-methylase SpoU
MSIERLADLEDQRLKPYRALKDRELARDGRRFLAEGEFVVRRLLASTFPVESVLLSERRAEELAAIVPPHVPVYVLPDPLIHRVIGFKFHSGVIACGIRKADAALDESLLKKRRLTLVACPETANAENLGSLVRISAAFGADAMLLGEHCCDPFWRQSIRVSMGTVFSLPIVRSKDLLGDLRRLREQSDVELLATVLDESAEPLGGARCRPRVALLFGNEAQGLGREHVAACDRRVTIPMRLGTDSLNVAVAAALFLFHFSQAGARQE